MNNYLKNIITLLTFSFFVSLAFVNADSGISVTAVNSNTIYSNSNQYTSSANYSGAIGVNQNGQYSQSQYTLGYPTQDRYDYANFCSVIRGPIYSKYGNEVRELQGALRYQIMPSLLQDGNHTLLTRRAVQIFQRQNGIYPSGYVGTQTYRAMRYLWCGNGSTPAPIPAPQPAPAPISVAAPAVSISLSPTTFISGQTVTLNWSAQNANTCTLNNTQVQTSGSQSVQIGSGLTSYTISCTGQGGTSVQTISTNYTGGSTGAIQTPNVTAYTTTPNLSVGQSAIINLVSSNIQSCTVSGGSYNGNSVAVNGNISVNPSTTTTYTFNCIGTNGQTVTAQVVVNVANIITNTVPTISSFTSSVTNQNLSQPVAIILNWNSINSNYCTFNPKPDSSQNYGASGSVTTYPINTTTYNLTCTNNYGTSTASSVTVNVNNTSTTQNTITAFTGTLNNNNVSLNWTGTGNTACSLYRYSSLGPTDASYYDSNKILVASNLPINSQYQTGFIGTNANTSSPIMQLSLDCGGVKSYVTVSGSNINTSVSVASSSINTMQNQTINWNISTTTNPQGMFISLYDTNNNYIGHIDRLTTTLLNGSKTWNIPKVVYGYGGDVSSCINVDGQQYCGISPKQIIPGSYKIKTTYFTPSNACFGFCPEIVGQQTLGTYDSPLFYINNTTTSSSQAYYDAALGAQVSISSKTLTLSFSGTGNACYAGTVNFGDGTSSSYSPSGANCTANLVKTYVNTGRYQIIKTINGVMSGTNFIDIQ